MKIKHVGPRAIGTQPDQDGESFQAFGLSFTHGGEAEISDRHPDAGDIANRVHGNPHFKLLEAPKGWEPPGGEEDEKDDFSVDEDAEAERRDVIAKLIELHAPVDRRKSLASLKGDLAKAEAEQAS